MELQGFAHNVLASREAISTKRRNPGVLSGLTAQQCGHAWSKAYTNLISRVGVPLVCHSLEKSRVRYVLLSRIAYRLKLN